MGSHQVRVAHFEKTVDMRHMNFSQYVREHTIYTSIVIHF